MPPVIPSHVAIVDRQLCDACGLCMPLCPPLAITMRREGLIVWADVCTGCRKCIAPCPVGALTMIPNPLLLDAGATRSVTEIGPMGTVA